MPILSDFEGNITLENAPEHAAFGRVEFFGVFGRDEGDLRVFGNRSDVEEVGERLALHKGYLRFWGEEGKVLIKALLCYQHMRPGLGEELSVFPVTVQSIEILGDPSSE